MQCNVGLPRTTMRRSPLAALLLSALLVTHERAMVASQTPATPLTLNVSQTELQSGRWGSLY